jgi:hypothetical protein
MHWNPGSGDMTFVIGYRRWVTVSGRSRIGLRFMRVLRQSFKRLGWGDLHTLSALRTEQRRAMLQDREERPQSPMTAQAFDTNDLDHCAAGSADFVR